MAVELITGQTGFLNVTAENAGAFNAAIVGRGQYVMDGMAVTMKDAATAHVSGGVACMNGRAIYLNAAGEDLALEPCAAGQNRRDLIALEYAYGATGEGVTERARLVVIKGTPTVGAPSDPPYVSGSAASGAKLVDMPIARVSWAGIAPTVTALGSRTAPMADLLSRVDYDSGWVDLWVSADGHINIKARKVGRVVFVNGRVRNRTVTTEWDAITTLPAGFRPDMQTYFAGTGAAGNNVVQMDIEDDGIIYAKAMSGTVDGVLFSTSFPAA